MPQYPITVNAKPYSGNDPKKFAKYQLAHQQAKAIESFLNEEVKKGTKKDAVFNYGDIASRLGMDKKEVYKLLFPVGGGSNGITINKEGGDGQGN